MPNRLCPLRGKSKPSDPALLSASWAILRRVSLSIVLISLILGMGYAEAATDKRVALIIYNAQYKNLKPLTNPANDAALITSKLRELHFEVQLEHDLANATEFQRALEEFAKKLDKNTDALFYYAGHGFEFNGGTDLIGIDAKLQSEASVPVETYPLYSVIKTIERRASIALIFWDGCRDNPNPLAKVLQMAQSEASPSVRDSSVTIPPRPGDTLIVFSQAPNKPALDGEGKFSPFAEALAAHIAAPDLEVQSMLTLVTADVVEKTKSYRVPKRLSDLKRIFYFNARGNEQVAYEAEAKSSSAKMALAEQPLNQKSFTILSSEGPQDATSVPATRSPAIIQDNAPPAVTADAQSNPPVDAIGTGQGSSDVVVTGNIAQSAIMRKLRIAPNVSYWQSAATMASFGL